MEAKRVSLRSIVGDRIGDRVQKDVLKSIDIHLRKVTLSGAWNHAVFDVLHRVKNSVGAIVLERILRSSPPRRWRPYVPRHVGIHE